MLRMGSGQVKPTFKAPKNFFSSQAFHFSCTLCAFLSPAVTAAQR